MCFKKTLGKCEDVSFGENASTSFVGADASSATFGRSGECYEFAFLSGVC